MKKFILQISLFLFLFSSCGTDLTTQVNENDDFPLVEKWRTVVGGPLYAVDTQGEMISVLKPNEVASIDANTGKVLWTKSLPVTLSSRLHFSGDFLVVQNDEGLYVLDPLGNIKQEIRFSSKEQVDFIALFDNHAFVLRRQTWHLEAYDITAGTLAWTDHVKRGFMGLSYDSESGILYMLSLDFIRAYESTAGELLWEIDQWARAGIYDDGKLYYYGKDKNADVFFFSRYDTNQLIADWELPSSDVELEVYNLAVLDTILVASTNQGLYAFNKLTGMKTWFFTDDYFYTRPVAIGENIYVKSATSNVIYAISSETGQLSGTLRLEKRSAFSAIPGYEYGMGLLTSMDNLIIATSDAVYSFGIGD